MKKPLILITSICLISGCVATLPKSKAIATDRSTAAIVYGQGGGGVKGFFKDALIPIKPKTDIKLITVDGGTLESNPEAGDREYWIIPGKRTLKASCRFEIAGTEARGKTELSVTLEQGKNYYLEAKLLTSLKKGGLTDHRCEVTISETKPR